MIDSGVVHLVQHAARRFAVFLGDAGDLAPRLAAREQRGFQRGRGLGAEGLQEALALLAGRQLPGRHAADQHAQAADAGHQRQADQAVGGEHAQQLLFRQAERLAAALQVGWLAGQGGGSDRAALRQRDREFGDAGRGHAGRPDQHLAGRILEQDHGVVEVEQDARAARHRFEQRAFPLLAREGLADLGHQHQVAHLFREALLDRVDDRRSIRRRYRDVVGARQIDAQVDGGAVDLARGGGQHLVDLAGGQAAQRRAFGQRVRIVRVGGHQVRQAHDADQGMGRFQALARFVVVEHGVGQEGVELPALDQPGARFGVGDLQRALLDRAQVLVVARGEVEAVFLGRGRQQRQAPDVVQQPGEVGLFQVRIRDAVRDLARDHRRGQRVLPERAQVGAARMGEIIKGLEHRIADDQGLDHVGAERHQRLLQVGGAAAAVVSRAVGDRQQLAGHPRILGDQLGQLFHSQVVGLQMPEQLDENLRHRRQPGNKQAMSNVLVWLVHGLDRRRH